MATLTSFFTNVLGSLFGLILCRAGVHLFQGNLAVFMSHGISKLIDMKSRSYNFFAVDCKSRAHLLYPIKLIIVSVSVR